MSARPFVQFWLWISAFATLAGWTLSVVGELNWVGYTAAFALFSGFVFLQRRSFGLSSEGFLLAMRKGFRRLRRPMPLCFFVLAILIFVGGAIYPPDNYTGLTYRAGRVLQWLSHGHWFWIHTTDYRMNDRACGMEWLSAPILLFTRSTRGLFLLNFLPFLLLPGLIFSVFLQLGVRGRVAWYWMWLLPGGYTFLLQAGGNANDTFPTVYALAAIYFALRAVSGRAGNDAASSVATRDLWCSILAAALLTGAKASNLPLLLPWVIAIAPAVPALRKKIAATTAVLILAAAVSFLPTAILNMHNLRGDWSGLSIEQEGMNMRNPFVGIWGNAFLLLLDNFTPPFFPLASWWNQHALSALPHFLTTPMLRNFEEGFLWLGELPTEDWSGIGFGLSVLLAVSVIAGFFKARSPAPSPSRIGLASWLLPLPLKGAQDAIPNAKLVLLAPWVALAAYCMKTGMVTPDRLIAPYYPLLAPLLLIGRGQSELVRRVWWRSLVVGAVILGFIVLVLLPDRPLWPAQHVLDRLAIRHPGNHLISRARNVYSVYAKRSDPLADVRALLPPGVKVVGFIGAEDDCDISFWLPFGSRRVEHFLLSDSPERFRREGVEYAVVGGLNLKIRDVTLEDWLQRTGAEVVAQTNGTLKVSEGPQPWYIVQLK
jgi:hypothetical protein